MDRTAHGYPRLRDAIHGWLTPCRPGYVLGDHLRAGFEHPVGPAGDVRGHEHVRKRMERPLGREDRTGPRRIAIPDVERRTGDPPLGKGVIESALVHDLRARDVHQDGRRLQERELLYAEEPCVSA